MSVKELNEIWKNYCEEKQIEWIIQNGNSVHGIERQRILKSLNFLEISFTMANELGFYNPQKHLVVKCDNNLFKFSLLEWNPGIYRLRIKEYKIKSEHRVTIAANISAIMKGFYDIRLFELLPDIVCKRDRNQRRRVLL